MFHAIIGVAAFSQRFFGSFREHVFSLPGLLLAIDVRALNFYVSAKKRASSGASLPLLPLLGVICAKTVSCRRTNHTRGSQRNESKRLCAMGRQEWPYDGIDRLT